MLLNSEEYARAARHERPLRDSLLTTRGRARVLRAAPRARLGFASAVAGASLSFSLSTPPLAAARESNKPSGWSQVSAAQTSLQSGDYAGAERALRGVPNGDPAARDAETLREALRRALGQRVSSTVFARTDNQPVDSVSATLQGSFWATPRLELTAQTEATGLRWTDRRWGALARGGALYRVGPAMLDLRADFGGRAWSDDTSFPLGGASTELYPTARLRAGAGLSRSEELGTAAAAIEHILRDTAFVNGSAHDFHGFSGAARVEVTRFSDDNRMLVASAWATYSLLDRPVRLDIGYSAAYRDTAESRWNAPTNTYYPYTTPLRAFRHGPVLGAAFSANVVAVGISGSIALSANEQDPTVYPWYGWRREAPFQELKGFLRVVTSESSLELGYEYLRDGYYHWHTARVSTNVQL